MAVRRPRIKATANLAAIRRNSKTATSTDQKQTTTQPIKEENLSQLIQEDVDKTENVPKANEEIKTIKSPPPVPNPPLSPAFKYPNPVDHDTTQRQHYDPIRPASPRKEHRPNIHPPNFDLHLASSRKEMKSPSLQGFSSLTDSSPRKEIKSPSLHNYGPLSEPHSPKKHLTSPSFINIPRKRIRTESVTSTKSSVYSYDPRAAESGKNRKMSKAEESHRDSKRKRLNNIQNIDKATLTMYDMIYYNPNKNPMKKSTQVTNNNSSGMGSKKSSMENIPAAVEKEPSPAPTPPPTSALTAKTQITPQIKLGPNGEMILDEQSLIIENEREKEMRDTLANAEIVYDDEFSGNSGYYKREKRTREWPPEETIRFYRCLHTVGTDFSMMLQLFPNRNRRDLKLKFKKEEKMNLGLVNKALLFPKQFNILELKEQFDTEDQEIERQKEEERKKKEEMEEKIISQKKVRKKLISIVTSRNPRRRISKSQRALLSETVCIEDEAEEVDDVEECPTTNDEIIVPDVNVNEAVKFDINNMEIDLVDEAPVTDSFYASFETEVTSSSDNTDCNTSLKQNEEETINFTESEQKKLNEQQEESDSSDAETSPLDGDSSDEKVGFPFNIDINSLVLVESQDTENPDKPIFEIYVLVDQETGKLSDKPLDLSWEDVEMIRLLMEENGEEG